MIDPTAPLPGPPEPWAASPRPTPRPGPPYHMTDMIAAEPHLARRLLARLARPDSGAGPLAWSVRDTLRAGGHVVATGCGTSEHAAHGLVQILRDAVGHADRSRIVAEEAFELALDPPADALVIGVSHEGGTRATIRALEAARAAGARTATVTAAGNSPAATAADIVVVTGEVDRSWCHTVGYVAPMLAAASLAGHLAGAQPDAGAAATMLEAAASDSTAAEGIAGRLADVAHLVVAGSGADRVAGREMVLKVEEATWLPSAYRDLETLLHGHLAATGPVTGLVVVLTDQRRLAERVARARQALAAAAVVGLRSAAILAPDADRELDPALTPAGRLVVPDAGPLPAAVGSLLASAAALQLVTERLARARGTDPDSIRRDDPVYRDAAGATR